MDALVAGRETELALLVQVLEAQGPRVVFVYGMAGIGKSTLLARFGQECGQRGVEIVSLDCCSVEPTEQGFMDGLGTAFDRLLTAGSAVDCSPVVLLIDTYEVFRIADPWLRQQLLPRLGPGVRVVVAGREPPMLEWSVERGQLGGLVVLPLGPLDDHSVRTIIRSTGLVDGSATDDICRVSRGHPLALRLALETRLAEGGGVPDAEAMSRVVDALAGAFRAGLDEPTRRVLDAAAVPRRITRGVLTAMLGADADAALTTLSQLAFVQPTPEGLALHDAVQLAIAGRLRAVDPESFRRYRTAAWHHLETEARAVGRQELARSTADLLFLIDNPVVREAMFPAGAHLYSVEPSRVEDASDLQAIWHRHDPPESAAVLDRWLLRAPHAVRAIRARSGELVGCSIVAEWRDIPRSFEDHDPVTAAWAHHAAHHPLPPGQTTLVHRRVLASETGEGPSGPQAAAWVDLKRDYLRLRPQLGRLYTTVVDPAPFLSALVVLGFVPFSEPVLLGDHPFELASLSFGPDSVDGWLSRLAAVELGIVAGEFLDPSDRTVDVGATRVQLSPLEFGVLTRLSEGHGRAVTRAELLESVWGTSYTGGSNVVDAVIRSLRLKLGSSGSRVETARGVGYRFT